MLALIILISAVVVGSALLSMIEAALLSLPMVQARAFFQENRKNSKDLLAIKKDIHITIASLVIINNIISVAGPFFIGQQVLFIFGKYWIGWAAAALTVILIIFGDIIPKTLGERYKVSLSLFFAKPVRALVWIFSPVVKLILRLERPIVRKLAVSPMPKVTEEEIKLMLQLGREEGTVEMDEQMLCLRVFKLNDVHAAQIMKPIDQIYALPAHKTLEELKETITSSGFTRIAVYDKDPLDIVGMVQQWVLLREIAKDNYRAQVGDFMTKPIFVNLTTKADTLLEKFQAEQQHLFIVRDAAGKNVGLVTMEDVLEELFGEIYDEKDRVKEQKSK